LLHEKIELLHQKLDQLREREVVALTETVSKLLPEKPSGKKS
jgi:hypothetical protein